MFGYVTGILVALATVFCLYAGLELAAGNSLFEQERLSGVSTTSLLKTAKDRNSEDRIDAIVQLGKRPKDIESTFDTLAELTIDHNELIRFSAEASLNEIGAPATKFIRPLFDEKTTEGYKKGCSAIRSVGESCKIYMPEIKMLLKSDVAMERLSGVYALQGLGDSSEEAIEEIIDCIDDEKFNIQLMACRVLESLGPKAAPAKEALLKALEDGVPSIRGYAAICLASMDPSPDDSKVIELIAKKMQLDVREPLNPVEHQRYLNALGRFGPKAKMHLDKIREKLKHRDKFIQLHSAFALYKITGKADDSMDVFKNLIEQETYAPDALELVGQMGDKALPFVPSVMNCLDSDQPGSREMALTALANIGPKANAAIGKVEELLEDEDALVRIAARETLKILKSNLEKEKKK